MLVVSFLQCSILFKQNCSSIFVNLSESWGNQQLIAQFTGCINPFTPWQCFGENIYVSLTLKSLASVVCGFSVERPPTKQPATQAVKFEDEILWCLIPFKWKHSGRKFSRRCLHDACIGSVSSLGASLRSFSNDDGDGNENAKKQLCTWITLFQFAHFFAVTARLRRENAWFHALWRT